MPSAFRAQSRSVQRHVGLPSIAKARLWPAVDAVLAKARADHQEIGDQIVLGALNNVLTAHIVAGHYFEVHEILGKLLGVDVPAGKPSAETNGHFPGGKSLPDGEAKKPLARAAR